MKALILGGTGLVGKQVIHFLLDDDLYSKVIAVGRRPIGIEHPKLIEKIIDFDHIQKEVLDENIDHVFLCLGTTMAKAGSKAEFYKIDYTYTIEAAKWAQRYGAKKAVLVSAIGASTQSWFYYSKVKGQVEEDLMSLNFESTIIVRPSLLLGNRSEYRKGEVMAERLSQYMGFIYSGPMSKYKPVKAVDVAKKMIETAKISTNKIEYIESQNI